jgi:hypothetical protein
MYRALPRSDLDAALEAAPAQLPRKNGDVMALGVKDARGLTAGNTGAEVGAPGAGGAC